MLPSPQSFLDLGREQFFSDLTPWCRYFQESVLPIDKEFRNFFSGKLLNLANEEGQKRLIRKNCERLGCAETFLAKSNRQGFCPACQKWNENEKARSRMANLRKKASTLTFWVSFSLDLVILPAKIFPIKI